MIIYRPSFPLKTLDTEKFQKIAVAYKKCISIQYPKQKDKLKFKQGGSFRDFYDERPLNKNFVN